MRCNLLSKMCEMAQTHHLPSTNPAHGLLVKHGVECYKQAVNPSPLPFQVEEGTFLADTRYFP